MRGASSYHGRHNALVFSDKRGYVKLDLTDFGPNYPKMHNIIFEHLKEEITFIH